MNNKKFEITEIIDLTENASFTLVNDDFENEATVVIKDEKIGIYFENGDIEEFGDDYTSMLNRVNELGYKFVKLMNGAHRWKKYNPNPKSRNTGDCTIRAYCAAFNISWNTAYDKASKRAKEEGFVLDDKKIVEKILTEVFGCQISSFYNKKMVKVKDRVTVKDYAMANPYGTFICHVTGHLVTIRDGKYYDSWDSGDKKIDTIYLPPEK